MKDFLKFTLATVVGIVLSGIVLVVVGIIAVVGAATSAETETAVRDKSVLFLDLKGSLEERSEDNPLSQWNIIPDLPLVGNGTEVYGLDDILASIRKAKETEEVKGIYLQASFLGASFASLEEIRNALLDFKKSGKFIIAYGDDYTQGLYYLSSVADKVILNPQGMLDWSGLVSQPVFYSDLFRKLGVEAQVFKVGTYKSAVETYTNTEMSPASREQTTVLLTSVWKHMLNDVSQSRNIPVDSLNAYADKGLSFYPAEDVLACGLVDTLLYKEGVRNYLKQRLELDKDDEIRQLSVSEMVNVKRNVPRDKSGNIVAVYYAYGDIGGMQATEGIAPGKVVRDLRKLREDEHVKAVVLRVNSPGGSAYGSEQIWNEVSLLKAEKPVIVSMGDYAASGGYYISCAADTIVAQPTTVTGSIGIFGILLNPTGLLDKVGLDVDVVKTNKFSDFAAVGRPMSADEKALMQMYINRGYELFVKRCADGRGMTVEDIKQVAEGRVWTGEDAQKIGLVDELGGLDKAVQIAAQKAGVENYTLLEYPVKESFFSSLLNKKSGGYIESALRDYLGEYYPSFSLVKQMDKLDMVQARMPFDLNIR